MALSAAEKSIPFADADKLIAAHDGDVALLYLYRLRNGCTGAEKAARDLCRTLREIEAADEKLRRMGLAVSADADEKKPFSPPLPEAEDELPQYSGEDISRRSMEDPFFAAILAEARRIMGRNLSSVDMRTLFAAYDYYGLPADVMMMLINYCGEVYTRRYGSQRRPTARALQREAANWRDQEIMSIEQAEKYILGQQERSSLISRVKDALNIRGRELSRSEQEYVTTWLDMGFGPEELAIAYDRTVTNTGSLKWSYMNKIVLSWKDKGLLRAKDIEEKDNRPRRVNISAGRAESRPADLGSLADIIDQI